jgi:hypothetical protein
MGYKTYFSGFSSDEDSKGDIWFIIDFEECTLLQNELFFHSLRWIIDDLNNERDVRSFTLSIGDTSLSVFIT